MSARLYYVGDQGAVVLEQNGLKVDQYTSAAALVETHLRGLLVTCIDQPERHAELRDIYQTPLSTD
ncbi:MAG: hypothetical protein QNL18_08145 [Pseudomonadales bacterium]|jgi:hypothetical protein|tara:strand:+ start:203 stop:400 length:198 start_codon:yes stop_codon:yes gene_type:complete